ncbi:hypothetical protein PRIPAC_92736, partial [Pristionchus pacificus]|uniref:Smr domain-containing protein n=1 Tax=Pristionchus pacificus TaxID=54126 RepID=A0A2A6BB16_PRIPA
TSPVRYSVPARTAKRTSFDLDEMIRKNGGRQTFAEYSNVMMKLCKKYLAMKSLQASEEYLLLEVEIHEKHKEFNRYLDTDCLDVHYLPRTMAEEKLRQWINQIHNGRLLNVTYICTGKGNRSSNGVPVLKNMLVERARSIGYKCSDMVNNAGVVVLWRK